jgi:hypothetical protein
MSERKIPATGNDIKPNHPGTFLTVQPGPSHNLEPGSEAEVHIKIEGCCGDFAQGWFRLADLAEAIADAGMEPEKEHENDD